MSVYEHEIQFSPESTYEESSSQLSCPGKWDTDGPVIGPRPSWALVYIF